MNSMRLCGIDVLGALDAFWRYLICPRENQGDRKTDNDERDDETNDRIGNIEYWKNLSDALRERPTCDNVGDGNLVNVAPLQLGQKIARIHCLPAIYRAILPVKRQVFGDGRRELLVSH